MYIILYIYIIFVFIKGIFDFFFFWSESHWLFYLKVFFVPTLLWLSLTILNVSKRVDAQVGVTLEVRIDIFWRVISQYQNKQRAGYWAYLCLCLDTLVAALFAVAKAWKPFSRVTVEFCATIRKNKVCLQGKKYIYICIFYIYIYAGRCLLCSFFCCFFSKI